MLVSILVVKSIEAIEALQILGFTFSVSVTGDLVVRVKHKDAPTLLKLLKDDGY